MVDPSLQERITRYMMSAWSELYRKRLYDNAPECDGWIPSGFVEIVLHLARRGSGMKQDGPKRKRSIRQSEFPIIGM
jgi:hypothetical protein